MHCFLPGEPYIERLSLDWDLKEKHRLSTTVNEGNEDTLSCEAFVIAQGTHFTLHTHFAPCALTLHYRRASLRSLTSFTRSRPRSLEGYNLKSRSQAAALHSPIPVFLAFLLFSRSRVFSNPVQSLEFKIFLTCVSRCEG